MPAINTSSQFAQSRQMRFLYWAAVLNPIDLAARSMPIKRRDGERQRVLFARLDGIGDYVIWTGMFDAIRDIYPSDQYELLLVGNEAWRELVRPGMFSTEIYLRPKRFVVEPRYRFQKMREIRSTAADIAINPRLTREFLWNDSVIRVTGASERIASHGISNLLTSRQKRISDGWYTRLMAQPRVGEHELISQQRFLSELANESLTIQAKRPNAFDDALKTGRSADVDDGRYAVLFLGAQLTDKQWPVDKFAAVAEQMSQDHGLEIVIAGGPDEKELSEGFASKYRGPFRDVVGQTNLMQLAELISSAAIVVANDTGAAHIAVATDTPVVVVTPGNHVGRFFPYPTVVGGEPIRQASVLHEMECFGCGWDCIYDSRLRGEPTPCVENVSIDAVTKAVDRLLS